MKDERFYFIDHSIDDSIDHYIHYVARAKRVLENNMTPALGFAVREAAFYSSSSIEQLQAYMRPVDHEALREFLDAHGLTLSEVMAAFRATSRVDGWKP